MTDGKRVGVFGGTFDPIHVGHLAAVEDAAHILGLTRVLFVPNRQPPHKVGKKVSAATDRVAMVERAIADNPQFELSLIEQERSGLSHIIDTMRGHDFTMRDVCRRTIAAMRSHDEMAPVYCAIVLM